MAGGLEIPGHAAPTLTLSELPEPPIPVSEIGPIPPPPMFSSPSPTALLRQAAALEIDYRYSGKYHFHYYLHHIPEILLIILLRMHTSFSII